MGVRNIIKNIGNKAGDRIASLAELSSNEVAKVQLKREEYLLDLSKMDPNDDVAREITERMMAASSIEIYNAYLAQLRDLYLPINKDAEYDTPFDAPHNIRYFNITKWVTDKNENNIEKLVNVYAVLSDEDCNIALVFNRTKENTNVYLAVVNTHNDDNNVSANIYKQRLIDAIRGNFPGAEWKDDGFGIIPCLNNSRSYSVATASNIPTEKSEKFISQTIEKLLDGIVPQSREDEYTIVLLATPIKDVEERKLKLGEFYSGLVPYESWQTDFHIMENEARGSSATVGVNVGASAGIQNGQNYSISDTDSVTDSASGTKSTNKSDTITDGTSKADSSSTAKTDGTNITESLATGKTGSTGTSNTLTTGKTDSITGTVGADIHTSASATVGVNEQVGFMGTGVGANQSATVGVETGLSASVATGTSTMENVATGVTSNSGWSNTLTSALGKTASDTITQGITNTISNSVAKTTGTTVANTLGKAVTKAMATTAGVAKSTSLGANFGANFARSSTVTAMIGKNEGLTRSFTNYNIKHALELLEGQMKRLEQSTALGMWDFAAYVVSENSNVANNVAHSYLALTLGEESYMSKSAVNLWRGNVKDNKEKDIAENIVSYIRELRHPMFGLNPEVIQEDEEYSVYPSIVTATTGLSGKELAYSLNFPQKAISGLPILECASFARNVVTYDSVDESEKRINLGKVFHMNHEENNRIDLSLNSLASHTFITGSTGSGKSNTVYHIIDKAREHKVKFLVIEPAKGEYKHVYGNVNGVSVYGTNPVMSQMMKLNPFSFPDGIHILEHLDRLVEIFNVCWPMYAAMPAVLKSAVEKAYVDAGWDLLKSVNKYDRYMYPGFADVTRNVKEIIDSSEYDKENKGAYKGSLLTRLQSLTTGINGLVFCNDELSNPELFDENVIVDLSRVGSVETKSLLMGILVLKLQEYRMSAGIEMNSELRHITVMEEAHNLLRRTSIEQPSEGSNILGKSVEMISNAIAEMRTYGEGFIIADQAPGLMDMSVIRNTNTKIIMRLPDQGDRELVGKAANLNDDQIAELSKIPCGVAAVYQNEWIQPILCKVERFYSDAGKYMFEPDKENDVYGHDKELSKSLLTCIMDKELFRKGDKQDLRELKDLIIRSGLSTYVKADFIEYIDATKDEGINTLRKLVYDFFEAEKAIDESKNNSDINEWIESVINKLNPDITNYSKRQINLVTALILYEQTIRDSSYGNIFSRFTEIYRAGGGIF